MSSFENEKDIKNLGQAQHVETMPYESEKAGGQGVIDSNFGHYISDAAEAVNQQKEQTIREALKMYKWAIIYSVGYSA